MVELSLGYPGDTHDYSPPRIRYNGLVHIDGLLTMIRNWYSIHKMKFNEKKLKHAYGSKGLSKEIDWIGDKKVYDYLKIEMGIVFKIKDAIDVEVVKDGKKEKLQQVRMTIQINGLLKYDTFGYLGEGLFGHNLKRLYHRIMKKRFIFKYEDELDDLVKELHQKIIEYLNYESTISV